MFFPSVVSIINFFGNRDIVFNYIKYQKKEVNVDSLIYLDSEGTNTENVYGYSKELDNYNTEILFGSIHDDSIGYKLNIDSTGIAKKLIWYRKGSKKAYPAKKNDNEFPINKHLTKIFTLPVLWLISTILLILFWKKYLK
jgi:hypothetical protein